MTPTSGQTEQFSTRALLLAIVLIGMLFSIMLGNRPLTVPDEGRYVEIPREMVVTGDYLTPRLNGVKYFEKPVLFYWCEALAIKLFGLNEYTLRLWPAIFALLGCGAVIIAGSILFGEKTGIIAGLALGTSLLYYSFSRAIILDMPVTGLLTASLLAFLVGTNKAPGLARRLWFYGFYACAALAVLTKGLIGIVIPGMVIGAWILLLGEWRMLTQMYLPSGLLLFFAIAAPWHILVSRANPDFFQFYFIQEHFQRYLTKMHGRYKPVWFFIPVVLGGLFPWSVFMFQSIAHSIPRSWAGRGAHKNALFLILWAVLVFLFFSASSSKLVPYILPVFPPLALLIGRYLSGGKDPHVAEDEDADDDDETERPIVIGVKVGFGLLLFVAFLFAFAVLSLPFIPQAAEAADLLGLSLFWLTAILLIGPVIAWVQLKSRGLDAAVLTLAAMFSIFLISMNAVAPSVDTKSMKQLALGLRQNLKPGDEVASYQQYYQDLPVYLERRITVVDWGGELDFGRKAEDTSAWMMDDAPFFARWAGDKTIYLATKQALSASLIQRHPGLIFFPVAQDKRNIIYVNHKPPTAADSNAETPHQVPPSPEPQGAPGTPEQGHS